MVGKSKTPTQRTVSSAHRAPLQLLGERLQLALPRHPVESADLDVDRMNFAAPEGRQDLVAGLFERETAPDDAAALARHVDGAVEAQEVGSVEHVDMQRMAPIHSRSIEAGAASRSGPSTVRPSAFSTACTALI